MKLWGFILAILMLTGIANVKAQTLEHAVGYRGGLSRGLTYQFFYQPMQDVKLLLSFRDQGMQLSAMIEQYEPVMTSYQDQFFMYYGAGIHLGYTQNKYPDDANNYQFPYARHVQTRAVAGINGIIGMEYRIESIPLTFGADFKPFMEFFGKPFFRLNLSDFALSLKYQF